MKLKTLIASILTATTLIAPFGTTANAAPNYVSLSVPNVNSSFKAWMDYKTITDTSSAQYKFLKDWCWVDYDGFVRCDGETDLGITDNYYAIALGSYYGVAIGTKYKITLDTGNVFYGVLCDQKANKDTNSTNQYSSYYNIVEFLVNNKTWNISHLYIPGSEYYTIPTFIRSSGSANTYMPLNGSVISIERIDF